MIDINNESYDSKSSNVAIFNDGNSGEAPCNISIRKKTPEDKAESPDYKVFYTQPGTGPDGPSVNHAFWYDQSLGGRANAEETSENTRKAVRNLRHLVVATIGENYLGTLPQTETFKETLDNVMNLLQQVIKPTDVYYVYTNYGTTMGKPKSYLGPRNWPPFVRAEGGSPIEASNIERMERAQPDAVAAPTAASPASTEDW